MIHRADSRKRKGRIGIERTEDKREGEVLMAENHRAHTTEV